MDNWRVNKLETMIEEDPKDEFVMFALAQEYDKLGLLEQSVKWYNQLKTVNPDYVGLYYHLASVYAELEKEEEAVETYNIGIEIAKKLNDQHALSELQNAKLNYELEL